MAVISPRKPWCELSNRPKFCQASRRHCCQLTLTFLPYVYFIIQELLRFNVMINDASTVNVAIFRLLFLIILFDLRFYCHKLSNSCLVYTAGSWQVDELYCLIINWVFEITSVISSYVVYHIPKLLQWRSEYWTTEKKCPAISSVESNEMCFVALILNAAIAWADKLST